TNDGVSLMARLGARDRRSLTVPVALVVSIGAAGCARVPARQAPPAVLKIGVGTSTGLDRQYLARRVADNLAREALVRLGRNGRPEPWLAESWSTNGLMLRI